MKKIALEQTEKFKNSELCIATEYEFKDKDIDLSTAEIKGRYPESGYCVNTKVKEMIFVISGGGGEFALKMKQSFSKKAIPF